MSKITISLHDLLVEALGAETTFTPATIDVTELLEFNDIYEAELDLHEALAKQREIAVIWAIEDVQTVRPDLNEDQCWQVLQSVHDHHDATIGMNWETLESWADNQFPVSE
jgi:hypothetical protein